MLNKAKGAILDIDGVLEFQGKTCPGAIETIDALRNKGIILRYLTNSTLKSRAACAQKLQKAGFPVSCEEVITASYATAAFLKDLKPRSCWIMLESTGMEEFKDFAQTVDDPEYIVVGDYRQHFHFDTLNKALRLLRRGSKLIGMQSELVDTSAGEVELNVGAWVQLLADAAGVEAVYVGKPHSSVFELALSTIPLSKSEVVVVGDRVSTDIKGAQNVGLKSILLKTGEFDASDLVGDIQPDYAFDSIQEILELF